ncbi:TRAP transporter small permease [Roseibium marinum]|uniref:TRAP transporter small permease protein n=1 Tax=Roseibium marinum TaxID=281252 RepID=A0A2S3UJL0_9HYPH|nr:TRAP transporter small permease [Roseibium marinum]POF27896.1 TRAP-type C4-dicarboxylate transport system permease small subunit [Roseibium marinum]
MREGSERTDPVTRIMHAIAGIALTTMMLVVVGDIVLRAVFGVPIQGAYDVVSIALLVMTMFGIAPVVARRGEIVIDLADPFLPEIVLRLLAVLAALIGVFLFAFFGWAMIAPALDAWRWGERSLELGIPKWPLWGVAFAGLVGIFWAYLLQCRLSVRKAPDAPSEEGGL